MSLAGQVVSDLRGRRRVTLVLDFDQGLLKELHLLHSDDAIFWLVRVLILARADLELDVRQQLLNIVRLVERKRLLVLVESSFINVALSFLDLQRVVVLSAHQVNCKLALARDHVNHVFVLFDWYDDLLNFLSHDSNRLLLFLFAIGVLEGLACRRWLVLSVAPGTLNLRGIAQQPRSEAILQRQVAKVHLRYDSSHCHHFLGLLLLHSLVHLSLRG